MPPCLEHLADMTNNGSTKNDIFEKDLIAVFLK